MANFAWKKLGIFLGVVVLAMVLALPQVHAELILENEAGERESTRKVLLSSKKASDSVADSKTSVQVTVTPPGAAHADEPEVENLTRAELIRRERVRQELKNEDILQTRIEELRLRDESARTEQLLRDGEAGAVGGGEAAGPPETVVVSPEAADAVEVQAATVEDQVTTTQAKVLEAKADEETQIAVQARGGLANMTSTNGLDVNGRYSVGAGLVVGVADHLLLEAGFTYSEYGIDVVSQNAAVFQAQFGNFIPQGEGNEAMALKQNVIDLGLRLALLNKRARFRPFVGGGGAYSKGFINYDQRILDFIRSNQGNLTFLGGDHEMTSYLGFVSTGFDVKISNSISLSTALKYFMVLTSRENSGVVGQGVFNSFGNFATYEKALVGSSIARASFYTVHAGLNFVF